MRKGILSLIVSIGLVYAQSVIAADAPSKNQKADENKAVVQKNATDAPKHHPRHHAKHQHHAYHKDGYSDDDHYYSHHPRHRQGEHHKAHHAKYAKKQPVAQSSESKQMKKQANFHTQPSARELHANYQESKSYQIEKREMSSGLERSHR
ncbi:MAG: hypothetical protein HYX61_09980 [Gammaproteobacteria bacterium]|jgi:hypothetical protein|nr:hypothetical protein [Gammaproteobacteria bacterium]